MIAGAAAKVLVALAALSTIVALLASAGAAPGTTDDRRSGFDSMSPALQAMQVDETANPGLLWVDEGEALWSSKSGSRQRACASCHGDASDSMRGVAARYPAFDAKSGRPLALAGRINACRVRYQDAPKLDADDETMLALEAYVARQSRGLPLAPPDDARLAPDRARGEAIWRRPMGQFAMSCAQCHDGYAGRRLAGSVVPQAHPTGYPIYRLEWQTLGSLTRRVRGCMTGVRAEPFDDGAPELVQLELYLKQRAAGLPVEMPAVRP